MNNFLNGLDIIRKWTILILVIVIGFWAWNKFGNLPGPSQWFKAAPVRIDETPVLISEIKSIAELHTAQLYCEVITDSVVITDTEAAIEAIRKTLMLPVMIPGSFSGPKKIVMIVKGKVTAGFDLQALNENNLQIKGDSVWLTLPHARVMDIIVNPSGTEIFMEEGTWSSTEQNLVKQKAIRLMQNEARAKQLIRHAEQKGKQLMKDFLLASGYSFAEVEIK